MLYIFAGDDTKNKHIAYEKLIKSVPKGEELFFISRNGFNPVQIESFYSGSSLFSAKSIVVFSNIFEYEEIRDFVLEKLKLMSKSANSFVFLEGKLNKAILDVFKKSEAEMNIFELPREKTEKFDNFLIANAFEKRDKLNMWIYFRQAMDLGVGMEEIVGVLFWKIKDMLIKKNFRKFSETELENSVSCLSYLLPQARRAGLDAETAFEHFLLEAF